MTVQMLIANKEFLFRDGTNRVKYARGEVLDIRDENASDELILPFGDSETLPQWCRLRVTGDITQATSAHYKTNWQKNYEFTIERATGTGWQIKIEVDPGLVSPTGVNRTIRTDLQNRVETDFGFTTDTADANQLTVTIRKERDGSIVLPDGTSLADLAELRSVISDRFNHQNTPRRFYFTEAEMDRIETVMQGGASYAEVTKDVLLTNMFHRLDD